MIPLIERDVVQRNAWVKPAEFTDMLALAQSAPGVFAVNMAVFVGYRMRGRRYGGCYRMCFAVGGNNIAYSALLPSVPSYSGGEQYLHGVAPCCGCADSRSCVQGGQECKNRVGYIVDSYTHSVAYSLCGCFTHICHYSSRRAWIRVWQDERR